MPATLAPDKQDRIFTDWKSGVPIADTLKALDPISRATIVRYRQKFAAEHAARLRADNEHLAGEQLAAYEHDRHQARLDRKWNAAIHATDSIVKLAGLAKQTDSPRQDPITVTVVRPNDPHT